MTAPPNLVHSRENPLVKRLRSLQRSSTRSAERAFIVEGMRAVADAVEANIVPEIVVLSTEFDPGRLPPSLSMLPTRILAAPLFAGLCDTTTPQGIMAIVPFPDPPPGPAEPPLHVVVDGLRDPGNLGTLLRTCAGAGVTHIHLSRDTVDPFNPKVVRSAMGAHFRAPISELQLEHIGKALDSGQVVLSDAASATLYDHVDMTGPIWIIVGSEATGASAQVRAMATSAVSIPMATRTESLNAAVAASVIIFEALRQRRSSHVPRPMSA